MAEQQPGPPPARSSRGASGAAIAGVILILLGALFLAGQALDIDPFDVGWPLYVIAPGIALLAFGLTQPNGSGLTIAGSIVTIVGLILLYQNTFDHYESWAYAWALVGPGGSGVGMLLFGTRSGNARMARDGFRQVLVALALFTAGYIFFEGIIGISGRSFPLPEWMLPAAVILIGLAVLVRGLTYRRPPPGGWTSTSGGPDKGTD